MGAAGTSVMTTTPLPVPPPVKPVDGESSTTRHGLRRATIALWTACAVLLSVELYLLLPGAPLVLMIAAPVWFALPGVPLVLIAVVPCRAGASTWSR